MKKEKLTKKELREDIFITTLKKIALYIMHNKTQVRNGLILFGGGLLSCFIIWLCISVTLEKRYQKFNEAYNIYQQAISKNDRKLFQDAASAFDLYINKYRYGKLTQIAHFYKATCLYYLEDYKSAEELYKNFIKKYKNSYLCPIAYQNLAGVYEQSGRLNSAISIYKELLDRYGRVFNAAYCKLSMARCYEMLGKYKEAKDTYKEILIFYPASAWAEEAAFFYKLLVKKK